MIVILVVVVICVIVGLALATARFARRRDDSISSHRRALAALRDAEQHPSTWVETAPASGLTDHVHILDQPPANRVATRRRRPRRPPAGRRRSAAELAARPTIAQLPTAGSVPTMWLPAPVADADAVVAIDADVPDRAV